MHEVADQAVEKAGSSSPLILALDIGGTGLKAGLVDGKGRLRGPHLRVDTPAKPPPQELVAALVALAKPLSGYDRVAAGFPGVIRRGVILTSPTLGHPKLNGFNLEKALVQAFRKPARVMNDAEMQGLAALRRRRGLEMVITLGTGFGSALFWNGQPTPHLELSTHDFRHGQTYNQQLGNEALRRAGRKKWNRRLAKAIQALRALVHFDHLYIGGGNTANVRLKLPPDVSLVSNVNGLRGGAWAWRKSV